MSDPLFTISKINNGWLLTISVPGLMEIIKYGPNLETIIYFIKKYEGIVTVEK